MKKCNSIPSLAQFISYIKRNGWQIQSSPVQNALIFCNKQNVEIVLPKTKDLVDYDIRMNNALETLAAVENVSISNITISILNVFSDLIRVSVSDKIIKGGTIPLALATDFITGLKDLMAYSATSEELKACCFQRTIKKGMEFSEACRFGHTFVGSFGFSVACPLERKNQEYLMEGIEDPPFERKVTQRLYKGLARAQEAFRKEDISCIVEGYSTGLSANMADQIASLHEVAKNNDVRYAFTWSPEWKVDAETLKNPTIDIDYNFAEFMRSAAKSMREEEERISSEFVGLVVGLKSKNIPSEDDENLSSREVTIHLEGDNPVAPEIKFISTKDDYLAAVEAHKNGKKIKIYGVAEKIGKRWQILEYKDFSVV